jgi:ABC-type amino acid transport substrate-binding protein
MHVGRDLADKLFPGRFSVAENPFLEMPLAVAMPRGKNAPLLAAISRALGDFKRSAAYGVVLEKWLHGLHGPL